MATPQQLAHHGGACSSFRSLAPFPGVSFSAGSRFNGWRPLKAPASAADSSCSSPVCCCCRLPPPPLLLLLLHAAARPLRQVRKRHLQAPTPFGRTAGRATRARGAALLRLPLLGCGAVRLEGSPAAAAAVAVAMRGAPSLPVSQAARWPRPHQTVKLGGDQQLMADGLRSTLSPTRRSRPALFRCAEVP